ncbi:DUF3168 domain-containing protein [Paraburkholderia unamae]|uniref:Uncharacterized protein DUF3168 n=1 Tax=Paraburkholderia unamae TaxID=219649 RepID=A0ABX5KTX9_9BURK|nr:DUF3168 domain-containing protein [Paraburkholderia unamae]PVX86478.1 uncharacterized protein DUF3168 [Paraburkholderia unamae]
MSVEAKIFTLLSPLVDGRVFPGFAPDGTERPYITWQQFGGHVITLVAKEVPEKQNGFFQVNVWSGLSDEVDSLALQIEAAFITAADFSAKPMVAPVSQNEPDLGLYGKRMEFTVWSDR